MSSWKRCDTRPGSQPRKAEPMSQITLSVPDISCGHCKSSIEGAVNPLDGVETAVVAIDDRNVAIEYDGADTTLEAIVTAIDEQGYEVAS